MSRSEDYTQKWRDFTCAQLVMALCEKRAKESSILAEYAKETTPANLVPSLTDYVYVKTDIDDLYIYGWTLKDRIDIDKYALKIKGNRKLEKTAEVLIRDKKMLSEITELIRRGDINQIKSQYTALKFYSDQADSRRKAEKEREHAHWRKIYDECIAVLGESARG